MITLNQIKQSKLGYTLIEMVISLVILSILMTSTMGIIVSSSNVFISTSKAALDKQVGNSVFDLLEKMIKYTTHLEISDQQSSTLDQGFSIVEKDPDTTSGYLYYKRSKTEDPVPMYADAFYNNIRTLQYELEPVGKDGKHVNLIVRVFREGKMVFTREQVIRCVNLALVGGANGNAVYKSSTAPSINPYLSFSCDEMLFAGGTAAWTIEYKVNAYLAKYNAILKEYYQHLTKAINPVNTLYDTYIGLGKNSHLKKSVLETAVHNRNNAIWGVAEDNLISTAKNINANGELPNGVTWDNGDNPGNWNNIRAYYQKQIYDLLCFSPSTIMDEDDFYYKVIASKEELYTGFLLTYYSVDDKHKTVTKDTFPSFDDADEYFGSTTLSKYAIPSNSNNQDKMVILAYFKDDSNDFSTTGNILRRSTYTDPYYKLEAKNGDNALKVTTGLTDEGSGRSTRVASGNLKRYGPSSTVAAGLYMQTPYEIQENYNESVINTSNPFVLSTGFSLTNRNNSQSSSNSNIELFTDINSDTIWGVTVYYPKKSINVTKTTTSRNYTNYYLTSIGNAITINQASANDSVDSYNVANGTKYYEYTNGERTIGGSGKTSSIWDHGTLNLYGLVTRTYPTEKYTNYTSTSFSDEQNAKYNSWQLQSQALMAENSLHATNILSVANFGGTKSVYTTENYNPQSEYTRAVFTPKPEINNGNIKEGWYYYLEGSEGGTQTYYFFYLAAKSFTTTIGSEDNPNEIYDPNYVVNKDKIAVSLTAERDNETACEIQLFYKNSSLKYVSYDRADYVATDEGDGKVVKVDVNYYTVGCHQYTDWFLYAVDWTSWYTQNSTGLLNSVITGIRKLFAGDKSITTITAENAIYSLGGTGIYTVNSMDNDLRSFQAAWMVYHPGRGTWYYLPQDSSMISTTLSGLTWYSAKDGPTILDLTSWASSTAMQSDINNRKLSSSAIFGLVDTTSDVNWTSLPANAEKVG